MKRVMFYALAILAMVSCTNDDVIENLSTGQIEDVKVVTLPTDMKTKSVGDSNEQILQFKDEITFNNYVKELNAKSKSERLSWETGLGFKSLNTLFDEAMNDAAEMDQTEASYRTFKNKYAQYLYFPEYQEDYGAYIPVSKKNLSVVLNKYGEVIVGNEKRNYVDIDDYVSLQLTGEAYYEIEGDTPTTYAYSNGDYVDAQYDSGWTEEDDRKLKLKIGRRIYNSDNGTGLFLMKLHYEISFRKKTVFGWSNYSSETTTNTTITFANSQTLNYTQTEEGRSSHDHYVTDHHHHQMVVSLNNGEFVTTRINGSATISFRGFTHPVTYTFDMPGGFVFSNLL